jgi:putative ABC transport system permease protein
MNLLRLVFDNLFRNPLRTIFTSLATMIMVLVVTVVFSILSFLSAATTEKAANLKGIVTERWQIPSQMPWAYATGLAEGGGHRPGDLRVEPKDAMTWSFYGGSTDPDPKKRSINTILFAFALEPRDLTEMMDGLDDLQGQAKEDFAKVIAKLDETKTGLIVGRERLANLGKRVGDKVKVYSFNYRGIDLEFDIVGEFPDGRYNPSAAMRSDYLISAMDAWSRDNAGQPHAMAGKSLNLVWLRLKDRPTFDQVSDQILTNPAYSSPAVKFETASSGIATFLEAYRDLIWGMQWLLAPAILFTLSLVIATSIYISARERRMEFAVMKVLGYRPGQIMFLVLTEALLLGVISGTVSAGGTYLLVNQGLGGLKFPIAFFGIFFISTSAWWWGAVIGASTALAGSIIPAIDSGSVRVADVFSKTA